MAKIDNITYEHKLSQAIRFFRRPCRLSKKAVHLLGMEAYRIAVGRREEDHDMCIHQLIDYVHTLEKIEGIHE